MRARLDRSPEGEVVLTVPTLSYVEQTKDVHTGALIAIVGKEVVITCELGDADVVGPGGREAVRAGSRCRTRASTRCSRPRS